MLTRWNSEPPDGVLPSEDSFIEACSSRSFRFLPARFPLLVFLGAGDWGSPPSDSGEQWMHYQTEGNG